MAVLWKTGPGPDRVDPVREPRLPAAIRKARLRARLTQPELSHKLAATGLQAPVWLISAWETGRSEPSLDQVEALEHQLGLPEGALLLKVSRTRLDPKTRDLQNRLSVERLFYVTTTVVEHVHVGPNGAVDRIKVAQRILALREVRTCFLVHENDEEKHPVRVAPGPGLRPGNSRPHPGGLVETRIELDTPLAEGRERTVRYEVSHRYLHDPAPEDRRHRHNGTHLHRRIGITVSFREPGAAVTWGISRDRRRPAEVITSIPRLPGRSSTMQWSYPGEVGCLVAWRSR